jgi:peptidoglycan/LPS O-acetylase OafA/YrhL
VLTWRPLVGLGKISYSLYLWNALFLFANHGDAAGDPHYRAALAAIDVAAAVGVSWLSYRFVEQRFRRRREVRAADLMPRRLAVESAGARLHV